MKFSAALLFAGAAAAQFTNGTVTKTEIVQSIVTFCPVDTTITHSGVKYTGTAGGHITITNCPCTKTTVVTPTVIPVCNTCNATKPGESKPPAVSNPAPAPTPIPTGGLKPSPPPVVAGAAKLSGAGLAAVVGAAMLL